MHFRINMYVVDGLGRKKRHVVGLAPVSGMCNSLNSCTISEGTSFQVITRSSDTADIADSVTELSINLFFYDLSYCNY